MFENRHHPPLSRPAFRNRLLRHAVFVLVMMSGSMALGMWGYEHFEGLPWRDAFLNAAMLLGGMGPVAPLNSNGGKLFAGFFALYAGVVFLFSAGLLIAPVAHRILHKFHWDDEQEKQRRQDKRGSAARGTGPTGCSGSGPHP